MEKTITIQGRNTTQKDIELVRKIIDASPSLNRTQLSKELCSLWNWRAANGQLKNMAAYSFLLKLEKQGLITLPARKRPPVNAKRNSSIALVLHSTLPVIAKLKTLTPLKVSPAEDKDTLSLFKCFLSAYHYLGFSGTVGENLKYIVYDRHDRPLACLLFGSCAWKCAPRDDFIGWDQSQRGKNLSLVTNNVRFLILPWVKVEHLASHILAKVARRIRADWTAKYGHPVYILETFVEATRFRGTCYKASNWICVGKTKGRSRNDRYSTLKVPVKDIYLYPLVKRFREVLSP
ncbi:MAG: Druantia anti-phage system protein DruA [Candidatus Humimicrobiaceae bacterium]